eukprot:g11438.t1.1.5e17418b g11438  g11438.t1 contig5:858507-859747(-)
MRKCHRRRRRLGMLGRRRIRYDVKGDAMHTTLPQSVPKRRAMMGSSSAKTLRDPNAPKRNMSAYLLYQNCMRETFKNNNPGITFGQLAKYTSYMYKAQSHEEKARWEAHAAQDKARYEAEMASYVPPPGYDASGNLVEDRRINKKYLKKQKDPEQPKRARGSFVFFTFEHRPKVMEEFPGIKFVEMGSILGERWRSLPAEEKQKYEDQAQEDKLRFNAEMEKYSANRVALEPPQAIPENDPQWAHYAAAGQEHAAYYAHYGHHDPSMHGHPQQYDPAIHGDPYAQHAAYQQQYGQYHYS